VSDIAALPRTALEALRAEVRSASWFAAIGKPLTPGERADAEAYAQALGVKDIEPARNWADAERLLKSPDGSTVWWEHEEALRRALLAEAGRLYPERALWTALSDLTSETGDLVHGKAAMAASRERNVPAASIHVAAGAASHAVYQLAVARLAKTDEPLFEIKFRLFAAGRWPLGVVRSTLGLF
jgi:hypothetical protein